MLFIFLASIIVHVTLTTTPVIQQAPNMEHTTATLVKKCLLIDYEIKESSDNTE